MNANVAIQVLPGVSTDEEVVRIVDEVIAYIRSTGVTYYVGPCETAMEGDYEELMEIVKQCQYIAIKAGCPSVMSYVKITYKPEGEVLTIDQKHQSITDYWIPISVILIFLIVWQVVSMTGLIPGYMLPSPVKVIKAFIGDFRC